MKPRQVIPAELLRLATRQAGCLGRQQVLAAGVSDRVVHRLLGNETWIPLTPGVYGVGPVTWHMRAWAGVLAGGPAASLGLTAAGYLQGLLDLPSPKIEVFVGRLDQVRRAPGWYFVRGDRPAVGTPPRTPAEVTVVDLCRRLRPDAIAALLARALDARRVDPEAILAVLAANARHPARALVRDILAQVADGAESPLEVRYYRDVERAHGLPRAVRQANPSGNHRTDGWYELYETLVELDGRVHHQGLAAFADQDRDNAHALLGLRTLRFGWKQVAGDPCLVARQVAAALRAGGWTGSLTPCPRCRVS
jgi:very-short-patch-repair endonuclease